MQTEGPIHYIQHVLTHSHTQPLTVTLAFTWHILPVFISAAALRQQSWGTNKLLHGEAGDAAFSVSCYDKDQDQCQHSHLHEDSEERGSRYEGGVGD